MKLDTDHIRGLCFDVDGTLRDTDDHLVNRLVGLLHPLRGLFPEGDPHPWSRRLIMALEDPATWLYGLPDRLNIDFHTERIVEWLFQHDVGKEVHSYMLVQGVDDMLERLFPHYPMAVVTARGQRDTLAFLDHVELTRYFKVIVSSQTCRHTKPYPDPILWAVQEMGIEPDECLMVGDTTVDIIAGKAAGTQTVGVLCGFGDKDELIHAGADLILDTTAKLPELLLKRR